MVNDDDVGLYTDDMPVMVQWLVVPDIDVTTVGVPEKPQPLMFTVRTIPVLL
jgi:hypothetical protein